MRCANGSCSITGASGGLGRACALACARAGATVVLAGRKVRPLESLYDELEALGAPTPAIYPINLEGATPDDHASLAEAIRIQCGRLDAIVHAAVLFDGLRPVEQIKPADWLRIQQVAEETAVVTCQGSPLLDSGNGDGRGDREPFRQHAGPGAVPDGRGDQPLPPRGIVPGMQR